jgi:hypothetical protein
MNKNINSRAELTELLERLIENRLTPEQARQLEMRLRSEPMARRYYVEYLQVHAGLSLQDRLLTGSSSLDELAHAVSNLESTAPLPPRRVPLWRRATPLKLAASLALILAGFLLGAFAIMPDPDSQFIATLSVTKNCRWKACEQPTYEGAEVLPGKLELDEGLAIIRFHSGALLTLEGPASIILLDKMHCFIEYGKLTADIPPEAIGFSVKNQYGTVVDFGTKFGINALKDSGVEVEVFDGIVELRHTTSDNSLELLTGQGGLFENKGITMSKSQRESTNFTKPPASTEPPLFLSSTFGKGQTSYVSSTGTVAATHNKWETFSDILVLMKNTDQHDKGFNRKAYISFDLEQIRSQEVKSATLTLQFLPTGIGYASNVSDCIFSVYGIKDESLDNWNSESINWVNAPGNLPGGGEVDLEKVMLLGNFTIDSGIQKTSMSIQTEELTKFLSNDTNGLITLVIVRDSKELERVGLVHGFAGNNHRTSAPPTLSIFFEN